MIDVKWRDTIDPTTITFEKFKLTEVLGYPHAGNDVFYVEGIYEKSKVKAYLKVERQIGADIVREVSTILKINYQFKPEVLEYSLKSPRYILTKEAQGEKLSVILGENEKLQSLAYLRKYGGRLAELHQIRGEFLHVKPRKFFNIPDEKFLKDCDLMSIRDYLQENQPKEISQCFVHGDFHYANVLWKNHNISCVLDYELSGIGNRDFDIAWAVILRPSQKFLKTNIEIEEFLKGYESISNLNRSNINYYMALIYCYFYEIGLKSGNCSYCDYIRSFIRSILN